MSLGPSTAVAATEGTATDEPPIVFPRFELRLPASLSVGKFVTRFDCALSDSSEDAVSGAEKVVGGGGETTPDIADPDAADWLRDPDADIGTGFIDGPMRKPQSALSRPSNS